MIVPMKKVSIVIFDRLRDQSLRALRRLGLVHIESRPAASDELSRLQDQKSLLERARTLLPEDQKKEKGRTESALTETDATPSRDERRI